MRETSREPTLSDTARWLGQPHEPLAPEWWQDFDVPELTPSGRVRMWTQLRYLQRLGIDIDRHLLSKVIDEASEYGDRLDARLTSSIEPEATVYYLRIGSLIKIGQTRDLERRLAAYPPDTVVLATETGPRDQLEAERHAQFGDARVGRYRREWFHPNAALIEHINSLRPEPLTAAELAG